MFAKSGPAAKSEKVGPISREIIFQEFCSGTFVSLAVE